MSWSDGFYLIGVFFTLHLLFQLLKGLYRLFYPFFLGRPINLRKAAGGEWAVVTGSTDGIGRSYAVELALRGFHVLLISRNEAKLAVTKEHIARLANTEIRTHQLDFSTASTQDYEELRGKLEDLDVGVLVNNVGVGIEYPEYIHEQSLDQLKTIATVNVQPHTFLPAFVLPKMRQRQAGIIIDIASSASFFPFSLWNVYSASKKYHVWLSNIVRNENASKGIIVQTITPYFVATNMTRIENPNFFTPNADMFVKSAIRTIGLANETTGYFAHQLQCELAHLLPSFIVHRLTDKLSHFLKDQAIEEKKQTAKKTS